MSAQQIKKTNGYTKESLNLRAADFYKGIRKPESEWKDINDLTAPMSEFPHLVKAEAYDRAFGLIEELEPYLMVWGYYNKLTEMRRELLGNLDDHKELVNKGNLGKAYGYVGRGQEALDLLEEARSGLEKKNDPINAGRFRGWIGMAMLIMGRIPEAFELCKKASDIAKKNNDRLYEAWWLLCIGWIALALMGDSANAVDFCEQCEEIFSQLHEANELNIWGRASKELNNADLGHAYNLHGHKEKALEILKKALSIAIDIGDHMTVLVALGYIGDVNRSRFQGDQALEYYNKALDNARKAGVQRFVAQNLSSLGNLQRDHAFYQHISGKTKESLESLGQAVATYKKGKDMEKQIGADPVIRVLYGRLGNVYSMMGGKGKEVTFELAHDSLDKALKMAGPDESAKGHIYLYLGLNQLRNGDLKKAQTHFKEADKTQIHLAAFCQGVLLIKDPKMGTNYKNAEEAFKKSLEECGKRIQALKEIEIKQKANLQYIRTYSLAGLAAVTKCEKQETHLEEAKQEMTNAFKTYKSPDLFHDAYEHLLAIQDASGIKEVVEPLISMLRAEVLSSLAGAS